MSIIRQNKKVIAVKRGTSTVAAVKRGTGLVYQSAVPEVTDWDVLADIYIEDTTTPVRVIQNTDYLLKMFIDDKQVSLTREYTFPSTGTHTIKYQFLDRTKIGGYAFMECTYLTSVTIADNITSIGENAFDGCWNVRSVNIPNSVTSIGKNAFITCVGLGSIVIPDKITHIESHTFSNCTNLTSVTIPNSVTTIGDYAFSYCSHLTSITIPYGVKTIGNNVFSNCISLRNIIIPDSVTSIGERVFEECTSLRDIIIPDSVTSIGEWTFDYCRSLTSVTIGSGVTSIGNYAFNDCEILTNIIIPDSVTSIGKYAFNECGYLTSVTIGSGVTSIGDYAFDSCRNLANITVNAPTAPALGNSVFNDISNYGTLYFSCGSDYSTWRDALPYDWFFSCVNDMSYDVTATYKIPSNGVIKLCQSVTAMTAMYVDGLEYPPMDEIEVNPVGITTTDIGFTFTGTTIPAATFSGCSGITEIVIGDKITYLANGTAFVTVSPGAFGAMSGLKSVTLGNGIKSISCLYSNALAKGSTSPFNGSTSGLTTINLGSGIEKLEGPVFYGQANLTSITIPSNVKYIWNQNGNGTEANNNGYGVFMKSGLREVYLEHTDVAPEIGENCIPNGNAGTVWYKEGCDISHWQTQLTEWSFEPYD